MVLGGRRKNKKEEGNVIEEVFKTGSEKDEIKKNYRVYSLNSFYYGICQYEYRDLLYIISVTVFKVGPPGYFTHISITTPIVFALNNYYI